MKKYTIINSIIISIVALAVVVGVSSAQSGGLSQAKEAFLIKLGNIFLEDLQPQAPVQEFGGTFSDNQNDIATTTTAFQSEGNLNIEHQLRYGDDPVINSNSVTHDFFFKNFNSASTTLFSIQNTTGKTVYLDAMAFELTGLSTSSAYHFIVGTTSDGLVPTDDATQRAIVNPDNTLTALFDNVLVSDLGVYDVTGTVLWLNQNPQWYPPNKGYGIFTHGSEPAGVATTSNPLFVPIKPGEYITAYASSTEDANESIVAGDTFDGKVYGRYRFLE